MGLAGAGWFGVQDMTPYLDFGANRGDLTTDGEWWRLASSMFLHFGLLHLLLNMWALLSTGHLVERLFGRTLFAVAYLGSGIAGSVASLLWHGTTPVWSAGASGAIFGVYGALLGFMLREKSALPKSVFGPLLNSTLFFAGYNLLYGAANSGIDNAAHLGGFAGGFVLGWLLALPLDRSLRTHAMPGRAFLGLAGTLVFIGVGIGFAPHFPYRLVDELAWEKAIKDPAAREPAIDTAERQAIADFKFTANNANLLAWLGNEGIPFYRDLSDQLARLSLDPHRLTARRRDAFLVAVRAKLASYEHLRDALVRRDPAALEHFQDDEEAVSAANARLGAVDK